MTDLISREAVIEAIRNVKQWHFTELLEVLSAVKETPAIEPKPEYIDNSLIIKHYSNGMIAMNEECFKRLDSQPKQGEWQSERLVSEVTESMIQQTYEEGKTIGEHSALTVMKSLFHTEPKRAEWIVDGQDFYGGIEWCHCSACGNRESTDSVYTNTEIYPFCARCGADMRGGEGE